MSIFPFLKSQNTTFSKIHNFWLVQHFSKRLSDYGREFQVLFYKNIKKNFGRPEDSHFLTCNMVIDFWEGSMTPIFLIYGSKNRSQSLLSENIWLILSAEYKIKRYWAFYVKIGSFFTKIWIFSRFLGSDFLQILHTKRY